MKMYQLIAAYRKVHNLSVRKLAREIGVDHAQLFRLEKGQRTESSALAKILTWALSA